MIEFRSKDIYGDFYEKKGKPLVVIIGGSRPGLPAPLSDNLMQYLKLNYNVLLLAYFGVGQLPKSLQDIPIEYFINAIEFITKKYGIVHNKVIIIGQSKGGEAALVLTEYMDSATTIALVSGCYVFQGIPEDRFSIGSSEAKSSWTYNNKELPYIKFNFDEDIREELFKNAENKKFSLCYEYAVKRNFNKDALINLNNYKGKVFLISAEKDNYWPSKEMSNILVKNSRNNVSHISLDVEGHYLLEYSNSVNEIINYLKTI